jgi:CRP-like cAMP-binding protein
MIIREIDLFDGIGDEVEEEIVGIMETRRYQSGDVVFREGDTADNFYVLVNGAVDLFMGGASQAASVALKQGEAFGWSSLAGRKAYSGTVVCDAASTIYRINKNELDRVLRRHPVTGMLFYKRLAGLIGERVIRCHEKLATLQDGIG